MYQIIYPKTKTELLAAIQKAEIVKIEICDGADDRVASVLRQPKQTNTRRTVIIVDERV